MLKIAIISNTLQMSQYALKMILDNDTCSITKRSLSETCMSDGTQYICFSTSSNTRGMIFDQIILYNCFTSLPFDNEMAYMLRHSCIPKKYQILKYE